MTLLSWLSSIHADFEELVSKDLNVKREYWRRALKTDHILIKFDHKTKCGIPHGPTRLVIGTFDCQKNIAPLECVKSLENQTLIYKPLLPAKEEQARRIVSITLRDPLV